MNRILKIAANDLRVLAAVLIVICVAATAARAGTPCCEITNINTRTGMVTAKVNATGQTFQFSMRNRAQLTQLQVGQAVYANLKANQVSLDGNTPAGMILTAAPLDGVVARGTQAAPLDGIRATPMQLTGTIRSISSAGVGVVDGTSSWRFKLKDPTRGLGVNIDTSRGLMLERANMAGFGGLSWVCTGDWSKCACNPGSDCGSICKSTPVCNPKIPDECTCVGDPGKGGAN
jgi:hypothetical protein